ncbi:TRAP transporter small permease [Natribacillus halophilus]|uniref:TRAP-type C4-dicarboxylate transport system, small permease component n=1 Tax=Natribacillus halophilus TaxID=549003 RepID=A0A1G8MWV0_9BACI|nr:TRAP transporter small permease [Natribacillus halophilus]SDI72295.1 TRAP-type C4-dicarboxylate transport system, small permease component [Natribacillus halophilus]
MEKVIIKLNNGLQYAAQVVLIIMVFLVTFDVLGRWLFSQPISGAVEVTELGLSMVIFLTIAYTHLKEEHISIDFVFNKFPAKVQRIMEGIVNLIITALMLLLASSLFLYTERLLTAGRVTGDLGLPVYLFAGLAAICAIVFALTSLLLSLKYFGKVGK